MTTSFQVQNKQLPEYAHGKAILLTQMQKPNVMTRQVILKASEISEWLACWDGSTWTIEEIDDPDINNVKEPGEGNAQG
jgi:hypothetical protein